MASNEPQFKFRVAKQNAYCRSCDRLLKRNEDMMITLRSFRNCGQNIHLCPRCVNAMQEEILSVSTN